jgi:tRNA pseudouridine55 synthase
VALSGILLYPKPAGVTSHDVVARVRRRLGEETGRRVKVGHAGTLDPFATGLLLVVVGASTRAQRFLMALPKTYRAVARLGWVSDTGDRDGRLACTGRVPDQLELPTGELLQRPHAYSAVKVGGERLYEKARRGEFAEADARPITVYRFELLWRDGDRAGLEIECSSGTYVRQLVSDLGDAYCEELQRTAIGPFRLEQASEERLIPLEEALDFMPERILSEDEARVARNGVAVPVDSGQLTVDSSVPEPDLSTVNRQLSTPEHIRLTYQDRLLAIAERRDQKLKPVVVFRA